MATIDFSFSVSHSDKFTSYTVGYGETLIDAVRDAVKRAKADRLSIAKDRPCHLIKYLNGKVYDELYGRLGEFLAFPEQD